MAGASYEGLLGFPAIDGARRMPKDWNAIKGELDAFVRAATKLEKQQWFEAHGLDDVSFLEGLSADFAMKTFNGALFTDFDVQPLAGKAVAGERRNGRFVYRANEFTRVRVGSGGPEMTFETLNGNVRARRTGGRP